MESAGLSVVTGGFGFTGGYIARKLVALGGAVKTLTNRIPAGESYAGRLAVAPLNFNDPKGLTESLEGADVLYNTYWIRFSRSGLTFDHAVENTKTLIRCSREAGIRKLVHVSVTNASTDSALPYFRGKALVEEAVVDSGLSYGILRPALIFGNGDILINNIAWFLRRFPVFGIVGSGDYRVQPVSAEDLADIAFEASQRGGSESIDAVGPDTYTFDEFVRLIAVKIGSKAKLVHMSPWLALAASRLTGLAVRDVVLTRDEVEGLRTNLLVTDTPPTGRRRFSDWLEQNADWVGAGYVSELRRHWQ